MATLSDLTTQIKSYIDCLTVKVTDVNSTDVNVHQSASGNIPTWGITLDHLDGPQYTVISGTAVTSATTAIPTSYTVKTYVDVAKTAAVTAAKSYTDAKAVTTLATAQTFAVAAAATASATALNSAKTYADEGFVVKNTSSVANVIPTWGDTSGNKLTGLQYTVISGTTVTSATTAIPTSYTVLSGLTGLGKTLGARITTNSAGITSVSSTLNSHINAATNAHTPTAIGLGNVTNDKQIKALSSVTNGAIVEWDGTSGSSVKNGHTITSIVNSTDSLPTSGAVKTYVDNSISNVGNVIKPPVQTIVLLKGVTVTSEDDKCLCLVEDTGLYRYDYQSTATGSTGTPYLIVEPTSGTGRWLKMTPSTEDHNNLSGLQGGEGNGDFYHISANQFAEIHEHYLDFDEWDAKITYWESNAVGASGMIDPAKIFISDAIISEFSCPQIS